jgi:RNA polymerase sigma factor (sigma-70 family)
VEASALPASVGLARSRIAIGAPLLRLRSDEQLVSLFRAGNDEAFRAIHDRYRARMLAYTRQMLTGSPQDPEDAVQEIFVRAYAGLRANHRQLALRAWLYRIAHNRCIDELRRPHAVAMEIIDSLAPASHDPLAKVEQRDSLRRLIVDVQRLPEQQRSALLMRELAGMPYADVGGALGVSVPAVKSLLVRARIGLAQASEARDTACAEIREDLIASHDRGVRTSGLARRHMRDCSSCRQFRSEVRGVSRRFAALAPTLGPIGLLANLLGWGGGGAAATGSAVSGGAAAAGSGAAASAGVLAGGSGHVVTIIAAALVATGGAVEIQHIAGPGTYHSRPHHSVAAHQSHSQPAPLRVAAPPPVAPTPTSSQAQPAPAAAAQAPAPAPAAPAPAPHRTSATGAGGTKTSVHHARANNTQAVPLSQTLDPDRMMFTPNSSAGATTPNGSAASGTSTTGSSSASTTGASASGPASTSGGSSTGTTTGTTGAPPSGGTGGTAANGGGSAQPSGGSTAPASASANASGPLETSSASSSSSSTAAVGA